MSWKILGGSSTGTKHLAMEKVCQDYVGYTTLLEGNLVVGAVSDGAGSAKCSDLGSKLAVKVAISEIKTQKWDLKSLHEDQVERIFCKLIREVVNKLDAKAKANGLSINDLACTLLVFIASPNWLTAMQIGDGLIIVRPRGGSYQLLFAPDKGEYANETSFITTPNVRMQYSVRYTPFDFICAATDGIENISLIKQENWTPSTKFFEPLEKHISSVNSQKQKEADLYEFLGSARLNQATEDDKTLLICSYDERTNFANFNVDQLLSLEFSESSPIEINTNPVNKLELFDSKEERPLNLIKKANFFQLHINKNKHYSHHFNTPSSKRLVEKIFLVIIIIFTISCGILGFRIITLEYPKYGNLAKFYYESLLTTLEQSHRLKTNNSSKCYDSRQKNSIQLTPENMKTCIQGIQGQQLINFKVEGINMSIKGESSGQIATIEVTDKQQWNVTLPFTGKYHIEFKSINEQEKSQNYKLQVTPKPDRNTQKIYIKFIKK